MQGRLVHGDWRGAGWCGGGCSVGGSIGGACSGGVCCRAVCCGGVLCGAFCSRPVCSGAGCCGGICCGGGCFGGGHSRWRTKLAGPVHHELSNLTRWIHPWSVHSTWPLACPRVPPLLLHLPHLPELPQVLARGLPSLSADLSYFVPGVRRRRLPHRLVTLSHPRITVSMGGAFISTTISWALSRSNFLSPFLLRAPSLHPAAGEGKHQAVWRPLLVLLHSVDNLPEPALLVQHGSWHLLLEPALFPQHHSLSRLAHSSHSSAHPLGVAVLHILVHVMALGLAVFWRPTHRHRRATLLQAAGPRVHRRAQLLPAGRLDRRQAGPLRAGTQVLQAGWYLGRLGEGLAPAAGLFVRLQAHQPWPAELRAAVWIGTLCSTRSWTRRALRMAWF